MEGTRRAGTGHCAVDIPALRACQVTAEERDDEENLDMRTAHWLTEGHGAGEDAAGDVGVGDAAAAAALAVPWPQSAPHYRKC